MSDERTVFAIKVHALDELFEACKAYWSQHDDVTVRLVVGPSLPPTNPEGGWGSRPDCTWVAFAFEVTNNQGHIDYADEDWWGVAAPLSEALGMISFLTGSGRTDVVYAGVANLGRETTGAGEQTRDMLFLQSKHHFFDRSMLYGFGQFGLRGVELHGEAYPLEGPPPELVRDDLPKADLSLETWLDAKFGPPGALSGERLDEFQSLLVLVAEHGTPQDAAPDRINELRGLYPAG